MKKIIMLVVALWLAMACTACADEYLDGEELFYNEVYNHDNVWLVYDAGIVAECREAESKKVTNRKLVKRYCKKHYDGLKVRYVKSPSYKTITHRKGTVLVEIVKSKSHGKYGYTRDGYYIVYNKKVKRGKTVTSYLIYNPKNNAEDDVVAVVDNNKIR